MSAPDRIWVWQDYDGNWDGTWIAHGETLPPYRLPDAEYVNARLCAPRQDARAKEALQDMIALFSADNVLLKGTHLNATLELARGVLRDLEKR